MSSTLTDAARDLAERFDLRALPPDFYDDPFPTYHALRTHAPVKRMPDGAYLLTRYADVLAVYKDPLAFSSDKRAEFKPKYGDSPLYAHHTTSLVFNDPPLHTRVRRLILGALTPRAIESMEPALVELVDALLDRMAGKREVDLVEDFAAAIPIEIIGNLLAVPRAERGPLRGWSLAILGALEPVLTAEQFERGNRAVREFLDYLERLVAERTAHPGDPERDVLTRLIRGEVDGERLTHEELLHQCIFLLNAGHETTTNLIANALHALSAWPGEKARLIAQPGLIHSAVEEFLRFESSNQLGNRISTRDTVVGSVPLPAGTPITLCIGAANRDPAQFPDPDRLDLARSPNRHLAFGSGPHQCVGMHLARLEARVAIARFLARFPHYALAGTAVRGGRARFRGFLKIPCSVHGES
ncbi:MAG TPA: cytochrome P450 [Burkholderiales bacterium]|jgi:cytochrome P450